MDWVGLVSMETQSFIWLKLTGFLQNVYREIFLEKFADVIIYLTSVQG